MNLSRNNKFTAKIIRAPALVDDAKIFLCSWDPILSIEENLEKAARENIFGKRARSYVKQILRSFRERFIFGDERDAALRKLVNSHLPPDVVDKILYYYTALSDFLLYTFVTDYLFELYQQGKKTLSTREAQAYLRELSNKGKTRVYLLLGGHLHTDAMFVGAALCGCPILGRPHRSPLQKPSLPQLINATVFSSQAFSRTGKDMGKVFLIELVMAHLGSSRAEGMTLIIGFDPFDLDQEVLGVFGQGGDSSPSLEAK